jgi:hypothetical protein
MIGRFSTTARLLQAPAGFALRPGPVAGPADPPDGDRDPGRPASGRAVWTLVLRRPATRPQPDPNGGGFCSFCAADRRPPEPKEHSHEDATKAGDRHSRRCAGGYRLRPRRRLCRRDTGAPPKSGISAAGADGQHVHGNQGSRSGEAARHGERGGAHPGATAADGPATVHRPGGSRPGEAGSRAERGGACPQQVSARAAPVAARAPGGLAGGRVPRPRVRPRQIGARVHRLWPWEPSTVYPPFTAQSGCVAGPVRLASRARVRSASGTARRPS